MKNFIQETPQEAARRLAAAPLRKGFKPQALHEYMDAEGKSLYWRIRLKHLEKGEKWIRPMKLDSEGYSLGEPDFPNGKPLYRLQDLITRPDESVVVVEGEWCADALAKRGVLTTTSGAADSAASADWSILAGRDVMVWPDFDEAGRRYGMAVASVLSGLGCTVRLIDVEVLQVPPKGDAVDWLEAHPNAKAGDVLALPNRLAGEENEIHKDEALDGVELISGASIQPEAIHWLWQGWLAAGKLHILAGAPGTGKTTLALALAATLTTGGVWPDGGTAAVCNVIIWSGEDDPKDTLIPRLIACGADMRKVFFVGDTPLPLS